MASYIYDIATDFPNGVDIALLHEEVSNSTITVALDRIDSNATNVTIFFKAALLAPDITILDGIIATHNPLNVSVKSNQETIVITQSNYKPNIMAICSGTQSNPSPIILSSTAPDYVILDYTGQGVFNWIILRGSRDDYSLYIDIDGSISELNAEYIRSSSGVDIDRIEDIAPPIYGRSPGYIYFKPPNFWEFATRLNVSVKLTGDKTIKIYGYMEYRV